MHRTLKTLAWALLILIQTAHAQTAAHPPQDQHLRKLDATSSGTEVGNHGDPYYKRWRRQELITRQILASMKAEYLLPSAPQEVIDFLTYVDPMGKTRFELMEEDLKGSDIVFRKKGESNPDGTCAQTDTKPMSIIYISEKDCGDVTDQEIWETLIGDTTHHFGKNDKFSDFVSLSIIEGYLFHKKVDPELQLRKRYKGMVEGKETILYLSENVSRVLSVRGGLNLSLDRLPGLSSDKLGGFETSGRYSSFTCNIEGIGKDKDGKLAWGVIDSYPVYLEASVRIRPIHPPDTIQVEITHEYSSDGKCGTQEKYTVIQMVYLPPSPEELEQERLTINTRETKAALEAGDFKKALYFMSQGIFEREYATVLRTAAKKGAWDVAESAATLIPPAVTIPDLLFDLLETRNADFIEKLVNNPALKRHIRFDAKRNYYTPVGRLLGMRTQFTNRPEWEAFVVRLLPTFLRNGADLKAPITEITNVPRHALTHAVGQAFPSLPIVEVLLQNLSDTDIQTLDERKRTALDYLTLFWLQFRDQCKSPASQSGTAQQRYEALLNQFNQIHALLKAKGLTERQGCLFYSGSQCSYSEKEGFRFGLQTDFRTENKWGNLICG